MKYIIQRTGEAPLVFNGQMIAYANGKYVGRKRGENNRYFNIKLYRTIEKRYVLEIMYISKIDGEHDHTVATQVDWDKVEETLRSYEPTMPALEGGEKDHRRLREQYDFLIGLLLSQTEDFVVQVG